MRRGVEWNVSQGGRAPVERTGYASRGTIHPFEHLAHNRAVVARFFCDLRHFLRLTLPQAAYYLQVQPQVIEALETGQVEYLPPWAETSRVIMTYSAMAGVDGGAVLNAVGALLAQLSQTVVQEPPSQQQVRSPRLRHPSQTSQRFRHAGSVIASGAKRLPQGAIHQIKERPQRAVYAVSLPLGLLLLLMHVSVFDLVGKPFAAGVRAVSAYVQEHFAPVHEGFRYIDVGDPRSRRTDKLQISSGSY
jgi:hypothetical protein